MAKKPHPDRPFVDSLVIRLTPIGAVDARNMFGGHGLFMEGRMFALVARGALYLKADDGNRADFETAGMTAFKPYAEKPMTMPYFGVPESVLADNETFCAWSANAVQAAARAAKTKKRPKKKPPAG